MWRLAAPLHHVILKTIFRQKTSHWASGRPLFFKCFWHFIDSILTTNRANCWQINYNKNNPFVILVVQKACVTLLCDQLEVPGRLLSGRNWEKGFAESWMLPDIIPHKTTNKYNFRKHSDSKQTAGCICMLILDRTGGAVLSSVLRQMFTHIPTQEM